MKYALVITGLFVFCMGLVWAEPSGMVWVHVDNDPGVPGHEGFNGYMSKYETTNAQYCEFLNAAKATGDITVSGSTIYGADGSNSGEDFIGKPYYNLAGLGFTHNGAINGGASRINYSGGIFTVDGGFENHPITYVTWSGAKSFCEYYGYRLPTEWEWQAVADYYGTYTYGCGNTINNTIANYGYSVHPHGTTLVGSFGVFGYKLADMAGNVWEWTDSWISSKAVIMGGGWAILENETIFCKVSNRHSASPDIPNSNHGFRACRDTQPNDGLVGYWSFDDGSASQAYDYSGNNNHGDINGASPTTGKFGKALNFDGNNDYIIQNTPSNELQIDEDVTISLWVLQSNANSRQAIMRMNSQGESLSTNVLYYLAVDVDGKLTLFHETNDYGNIVLTTVNNYIVRNTFQHIIITRDVLAKCYKIYVNGQYGETLSYVHNPSKATSNNTQRLQIGALALNYPINQFFNGKLDEVRIYNRVLSSSEIADLYVDNRNTISIEAINNWDGSVDVTWDDQGEVGIIRQEVDDDGTPLSETGWSRSGDSFKDVYQLSELQKKYIYILRDLDGTELARTSETVYPAIIVVLVRGYDPLPTVISEVNPDYWTLHKEKKEDIDEYNILISSGLVDSVEEWFTNSERNITCWDASSDLNGTIGVVANYEYLKDFIELKFVGNYKNAKINLFGHSMGGLISRLYAEENEDKVLNVFCAQTPHAGSPLATIRGLFPDYHPATESTKPKSCKKFNDEVENKNTPIYSTYSENIRDFYNKSHLAITYGIIYDMLWGKSDGVVPVRSAKGNNFWGNEAIAITDVNNSNLDHSSCHKHINTLNKILEWLGYPQPGGAAPAMQIQTLSEPEPEIDPLYYIDGFSGQFDSGHLISEAVNIGTSQKAYFRATVSDPNCSFTLTNPGASIIDPNSAGSDPNIAYNSEDGIQSYEIAFPLSGAWTMNLTTLLTEPNGVEYGLTAFEDQFVTFSVTSERDWTNTGQPLLLTADVVDNSGAVTGATVSADVTLPDATVQITSLLDDGTNGDVTASDGIYSYLFASTSLEGTYDINANATGTTSTASAFERSAATSFTATPADIAITGAIIAEDIDINSNGYIDALGFTVPVNVSDANSYRLTASFIDPNSETISLVNTGLLSLTTDSNSISVEIDSDDIVNNNVPGPYTLSSIEILDGDTSLTIADANDYTTAAYLLSDFEPLDSDGDGLSDALEQGIGSDINKIDSDADGATDYQEVAFDGEPNSYNILADSNPLVQNSDTDTMTDGYEISYGLNPLIDDSLDDLDNDGLNNQQEYDLHTRPDKFDTDNDGRSDKWEVDNSADPIVYDNYILISGDINLDATADGIDLGLLAQQWLSIPEIPSADIAPEPNGDGQINLLDFALLAEHWLEVAP